MRVATFGLIARNLMEQNLQARVMGASSRGVFVGKPPQHGLACLCENSAHCGIASPQFPAGWVTFLSTETFRGPLTLNVVESQGHFQSMHTGQEAAIWPKGLYFPSERLFISTHQANTWQAPPRPETYLTPSRWRVRLPDHWPWDDLTLGFPRRIEDLSLALRNRTEAEAAHQLKMLLGLGSGLTPAGDDFALGVLLALTRWGDVLLPDLNVPETNQAIIASAYVKTTTLSANLIECATLGQADERLILALDAMMTDQPNLETTLNQALGWGESSGRAALEGMVLVIKAGILA